MIFLSTARAISFHYFVLKKENESIIIILEKNREIFWPNVISSIFLNHERICSFTLYYYLAHKQLSVLCIYA
jgi:hypothetical protein